MNRTFLFALALVAVASISFVAPAAAQENTTDLEPTFDVTLEGNTTNEEPARTFDSNTRLISKEHHNERAVLIIESDRRQAVTLTDGAKLMAGGSTRPVRVPLSEGRNRVEIDATEYRGNAFLTLDARGTLHGIQLDAGRSLFSPPYNSGDLTTSALAGLAAGLLTPFLIALRRIRGISDKPERLL